VSRVGAQTGVSRAVKQYVLRCFGDRAGAAGAGWGGAPLERGARGERVRAAAQKHQGPGVFPVEARGVAEVEGHLFREALLFVAVWC
jgi:hypothetical protein